MKYLLDVNALMAWSHPGSHGHAQFHAWAKAEGYGELATCAITELGFLRVTMQRFGCSLSDAEKLLEAMRQRAGGFVACPPPKLPTWANTHGKTTDAYLIQIAAEAGLKLATFDAGITGAVQI